MFQWKGTTKKTVTENGSIYFPHNRFLYLIIFRNKILHDDTNESCIKIKKISKKQNLIGKFT